MKEISINEGEMRMRAEVEVKLSMPEQTRDLLEKMERAMEESGQQYKRKMYEYGLERVDKDLVGYGARKLGHLTGRHWDTFDVG